MKTHWFIVSASIFTICVSGCVPTKEVTMYLQDLQVSGGVVTPPVHITENPSENEIHIIPRVSVGSVKNISGRIDGHTKVNKNGVFEVDTIFRSDNGVTFQDDGRTNTFTYDGKNLKREFPSYSLGIDLDFGLSKGIALSLGTNYSEVSNQGLWSYRAGIGFRSHKQNLGFRIDIGWQWEELYYRALTVVSERPLSNSTSTISFYSDKEKKSQGRFYASIIFNSVHTEWPFNPFLQLGMTSQGLNDIKPQNLDPAYRFFPPFFLVPLDDRVTSDKRGEFTSTMLHIVPGVYFNLDAQARILAGARLTFETAIEDRTNSMMVVPFLQLDFRF